MPKPMYVRFEMPKELVDKTYQSIELAKESGKVRKGTNEVTNRTYIGLAIVETSFRPAAAGRHQSSAPRPQRSGRRSGAGYKRFATVSGRLRRKRESTLAARLKSAGRGSTVMPTDRKFCRFAPTDRPLQTREIPEGGICLSAFVVLSESGHRDRILMGHLDPSA